MRELYVYNYSTLRLRCMQLKLTFSDIILVGNKFYNVIGKLNQKITRYGLRCWMD